MKDISADRLCLLNFLAVIQFVAAFNFANVSSTLHMRLFRYLVDVDGFFDMQFGDLQRKMTIDTESLKSMNLEAVGEENLLVINDLKQKYLNFSNKWEEWKGNLNTSMDDFKSLKGINSMFLFLSVYSIFDMIFISYNASIPKKGIEDFYFSCYTVFSAICLIIYFYLIFLRKLDRISKGFLHLLVCFLVLFCLVVSKIACSINFNFELWGICIFDKELFYNFADVLSIILPYFGFVLCLIFILINWLYVGLDIIKMINSFKQKQQKLHKEKLSIDDIYNRVGIGDVQFN